jgi:predicted membrane protein
METYIRPNIIIELGVAAILVLCPVLVALVPWKGKAGSRTASVMLVISVAVLAFFALMSDAIFGVSASWIFSLSVWAVGVGVCAAVWFRYRSIIPLILAPLITVFVLVLHFMDILPVKPYKRFFAAVQVGMTEQEVLGLLHREFPEGGRLSVPVRRDFTSNQMAFFLDPNESAWNAEAIFIQLNDGRVVSKKYSRD